ncbi:MAG: SDR family oxidoreductase [Erysipelotrichales bacterium]|nr:SDR family oxidoreductase [Erysipelotrichales bacterium]
MNKTVLITGASKGIGKQTAFIFAENNFNLILVARNKELLEEVKNTIKAEYQVEVLIISKDLTQKNAAKEILKQVINKKLRVDILINNAGFGDFSAYLDSKWDKQERIVELNIKALMELSYLFGKEMKKINEGQIINVASAAAVSPGPYMAVYYASKAFVLSFTEALAEEWKDSDVKIKVICPKATKSNFEEAAQMQDSEMFIKLRASTATEVAKAIYKLSNLKKTVYFYSLFSKSINVANRLTPRIVSRKVAGIINGVPTDKT